MKGLHALQQAVIFRERDLLPEEQQVLHMAHAVHVASGRNGLLPVELHAAMAGWSDIPSDPCAGEHSPVL
jgi:hypothetical protein